MLKKVSVFCIVGIALLSAKLSWSQDIQEADSTDIAPITNVEPAPEYFRGGGIMQNVSDLTMVVSSIPACPEGYQGILSTSITQVDHRAGSGEYFDGITDQTYPLCVINGVYRVAINAAASFNKNFHSHKSKPVDLTYTIYCVPAASPTYIDPSC